ncbi:MAG: hypothetical protein JKX97_01645 [Candidatus Lindowbacteria bacterium]|nr:hypothetical protein [Candidatus Lindowbacteria bacterium]
MKFAIQVLVLTCTLFFLGCGMSSTPAQVFKEYHQFLEKDDISGAKNLMSQAARETEEQEGVSGALKLHLEKDFMPSKLGSIKTSIKVTTATLSVQSDDPDFKGVQGHVIMKKEEGRWKVDSVTWDKNEK